MTVPNLDSLYECGSILSAVKSADFEKNEDQYKIILNGVKGDVSTKKLASQFIARFFSKFPNLANHALDAILDLCEDEDIDIRKQAIKDLPILCRDMKEFLPKIADVLSQLLQTEDKSEIVVVQNSLMSLFRRDAKGTLIGLFSQVRNGGDIVRDRALKFLHMKIKTSGPELLSSKETEAVLLEEIKHSIEECTADEFHMFMAMLAATSLQKSISGQSMIVELIANSCQLEKGIFDPNDEETVDRLLQCANAAIPFFSSQVKSTKFADYLTSKVLPQYSNLDGNVQTQVLKLLADVCMFTGMLQEPLKSLETVYELLMEAVPQKPENAEDSGDEFEFTKLECLLFAFHTLGQQAPHFLVDNPTLMKEFKTRLQYFALAIQGYIRKLDEFIKGKSKMELSSEENQLKLVAQRSAKNISAVIKDLFHSPPSYKTKIIVSWRPLNDKIALSAAKTTPSVAGLKRKSISFEGDSTNKKPANSSGINQSNQRKSGPFKKRPAMGLNKVYAPPQGKYSSNLGKVVDDEIFDGEQRQTGYYRGYSRGRGGRGRGGYRKFKY